VEFVSCCFQKLMLLCCCVECCLSHSFDWTCPRHELMVGKNFQGPLYTTNIN